MQQSEAEMGRGGARSGGPRGGRDRDRGDYGRNEYSRGDYGASTGNKRESDIRRRMTGIENDIATYRNNIEFFARSKNADKLRAEIDQKIADAEKQLDSLRQELRAAQE
jgi:ABC-type Fe3+-hydroxamate transport system substrate-binding protein